jgi:hypothetical protein
MHHTFSKFAIVFAAFAVIMGITALIIGQPASKLSLQPASKRVVGVVDDWSFHHLVFSNPGTYEQVAKDPAAYAKWLKIQYDTRFILQQMKRSSGVKTLAGPGTGGEEAVPPSGMAEPKDLAIGALRQFRPPIMLGPERTWRHTGLLGEWAKGILTGTVQPNTYPAKFGASLTTASCSDFVVYPTGTAGSASTASVIAFNNLYVGSSPACGASGSVPTVYWAYNTNGGTVSTSPILYTDGVQVAFIQVTGTTASLVILKSIQGSGVTVSSPTSFTSTTQTPSGCTYSSGATTITCTGGGFTSAADQYAVISGDNIPAGTTITLVDSSTEVTISNATTGSNGSPAVTISAPFNSGFVAPQNYRNCTAPCMTSLTFSGSYNDTYSAPFYDYASDDALYVGDDSGNLHQFTGVFAGIPTEATPVTLNSTAYVSSPVYDPTSGCVFVGDSEGYLYSVSSGVAGSVCTGNSFALYGNSENLGDGGANEGILDGPLVDSTAGMVYAFITDSGAIGTCAAGDNCVVQFATSTITSGSMTAAPNSEEDLGTGGAGFYLYSGAFDNAYFLSLPASFPTGNLWVVGNTGTAGGATLYRIPIAIATNTMGTPVAAVTGLSTTDYAYPSPVTEFCNNGTTGCSVSGGTEYIYFSVYGSTLTAHGTTCGASGVLGCVLDYNITGPPWSPTLAGVYPVQGVPTYETTEGCWVTGGFVIDNSATTTGASQVYFINLNGNEAGGPTSGTYTSSACQTTTGSGTGNTIYAQQVSQSALE